MENGERDILDFLTPESCDCEIDDKEVDKFISMKIINNNGDINKEKYILWFKEYVRHKLKEKKKKKDASSFDLLMQVIQEANMISFRACRRMNVPAKKIPLNGLMSKKGLKKFIINTLSAHDLIKKGMDITKDIKNDDQKENKKYKKLTRRQKLALMACLTLPAIMKIASETDEKQKKEDQEEIKLLYKEIQEYEKKNNLSKVEQVTKIEIDLDHPETEEKSRDEIEEMKEPWSDELFKFSYDPHKKFDFSWDNWYFRFVYMDCEEYLSSLSKEKKKDIKQKLIKDFVFGSTLCSLYPLDYGRRARFNSVEREMEEKTSARQVREIIAPQIPVEKEKVEIEVRDSLTLMNSGLMGFAANEDNGPDLAEEIEQLEPLIPDAFNDDNEN